MRNISSSMYSAQKASQKFSASDRRISTLKIVQNAKFQVTIFIIAGLIFSYLIFNAHKYTRIPTNINEIPLISANISPVRTTPEDPGGFDTKNNDKYIYTTLSGTNVHSLEDEYKPTQSVTLRNPRSATPTPKKNVTTEKKTSSNKKKSLFDFLG